MSRKEFEEYQEEIEEYKKSPCWLIATGIVLSLVIAKILGFIVLPWGFIAFIGFIITMIIVSFYEPEIPN